MEGLSVNWYNDKKNEWKDIIESVASEIKKSEEIVEKDIIQSMVLYKISMKDEKLVFKGGTSLSKAYNIIDRFSEDLDLSSKERLSEFERRRVKENIENIASEIGLKPINSKIWGRGILLVI